MDISEFSNFFLTREHYSAVSSFKSFSSAKMSSRMVGSQLKSGCLLLHEEVGL